MKKLSKLDFSDFYYCAEQKFVSLVTSLFKNLVRSDTAKGLDENGTDLGGRVHQETLRREMVVPWGHAVALPQVGAQMGTRSRPQS